MKSLQRILHDNPPLPQPQPASEPETVPEPNTQPEAEPEQTLIATTTENDNGQVADEGEYQAKDPVEDNGDRDRAGSDSLPSSLNKREWPARRSSYYEPCECARSSPVIKTSTDGIPPPNDTARPRSRPASQLGSQGRGPAVPKICEESKPLQPYTTSSPKLVNGIDKEDRTSGQGEDRQLVEEREGGEHEGEQDARQSIKSREIDEQIGIEEDLRKTPPISDHERPYQVNQVLTLNLDPVSDDRSSNVIRVRIMKVQACSTFSCGMVVKLLDPESIEGFPLLTSTETAFLKLYDSRHAHDHREVSALRIPWDNEIEEMCTECIKSGKADEFLEHMKVEDISLSMSEPVREVHNAERMLELFTAETMAYNRLQEHQGQVIPRLLASVHLDLTPAGIVPSPASNIFFHTRGILLQFLDGFNLDVLDTNAPREAWQDIFDQALNVLRVIDSKDVLNFDVRPENFIVVPESDQKYHVFSIDLGSSMLRDDDWEDEVWGQRKHDVEEEAALGECMQFILKKSSDFDLKFERSTKYDGFVWTEEDFQAWDDEHRKKQDSEDEETDKEEDRKPGQEEDQEQG